MHFLVTICYTIILKFQKFAKNSKKMSDPQKKHKQDC